MDVIPGTLARTDITSIANMLGSKCWPLISSYSPQANGKGVTGELGMKFYDTIEGRKLGQLIIFCPSITITFSNKRYTPEVFSSQNNVHPHVKFEELDHPKDHFSGAQMKAVYVQPGVPSLVKGTTKLKFGKRLARRWDFNKALLFWITMLCLFNPATSTDTCKAIFERYNSACQWKNFPLTRKGDISEQCCIPARKLYQNPYCFCTLLFSPYPLLPGLEPMNLLMVIQSCHHQPLRLSRCSSWSPSKGRKPTGQMLEEWTWWSSVEAVWTNANKVVLPMVSLLVTTVYYWKNRKPPPAGPVGPNGKDGDNGENGDDGNDGSPGKPGEDGKKGEQGRKGNPGKDKDGEPGEDGKDSESGEDDSDGDHGGRGGQEYLDT